MVEQNSHARTIDNREDPVTATPAPPRRRPRDRRAQILAAASDLFAERGYDKTSMTDIAWAVNIGPSALYRHFPGKQKLLSESIDVGIDPVRRIGEDLRHTGGADALASVAAHALEHRRLGLLWQREARHLPTEERTRIRDQLSELGAMYAGLVQSARPDLTPDNAELAAWALLSALASPALHNFSISDSEYAAALADVLSAMLTARFPDGQCSAIPASYSQHGPGASPPVPASRREDLLIAAVRLFARDGYAGVSIEDIGAAVGISAPSVYKHFSTKIEMLATAFQRGTGTLFTGVSAAYSGSADADQALRSLLHSYLVFAGGNQHLVGLLVTEIDHLPADERQAARDAQRTYLREWTHLLRIVRPDFTEAAARVRVSTTIDVVNSAARMSRFRGQADLRRTIEPLSLHMLGVDESTQDGHSATPRPAPAPAAAPAPEAAAAKTAENA